MIQTNTFIKSKQQKRLRHPRKLMTNHILLQPQEKHSEIEHNASNNVSNKFYTVSIKFTGLLGKKIVTIKNNHHL